MQSDLVNTTFEAFRKCYIMPLSRLPCTINDYQLIEKYKEWFDFMTIHKILGFLDSESLSMAMISGRFKLFWKKY